MTDGGDTQKKKTINDNSEKKDEHNPKQIIILEELRQKIGGGMIQYSS